MAGWSAFRVLYWVVVGSGWVLPRTLGGMSENEEQAKAEPQDDQNPVVEFYADSVKATAHGLSEGYQAMKEEWNRE